MAARGAAHGWWRAALRAEVGIARMALPHFGHALLSLMRKKSIPQYGSSARAFGRLARSAAVHDMAANASSFTLALGRGIRGRPAES
jgi:hypothetical protein